LLARSAKVHSNMNKEQVKNEGYAIALSITLHIHTFGFSE
jgi:hypothetical protein